VQAGRSRVRIPSGTGDYTLLQNLQTGSEAQPSSYSMDTGGSLLQTRREDNHSPPSNAVAENVWRYNSTPHI